MKKIVISPTAYIRPTWLELTLYPCFRLNIFAIDIEIDKLTAAIVIAGTIN
jgi:hypothetical protein